MTHPHPLPSWLPQAWAIVWHRKWCLIAPVALSTLLSLSLVLTRTPVWQATQALVVRDEAVGSMGRQGSFESSDKMKAFQETLLEVARSRNVVAAALQVLGPPADRSPESAEWPSETDVLALQQQIKVGAPRGAEFGKTEVIYLTVTGRTPEQARSRVSALCDQLEKHLAELRDARATSLVAEQERTLGLAQQDRDRAIEKLKEMERAVGVDLGDLRALSEFGSSTGNLKLSVNQLTTELRQAELTAENQKNMRQLLLAAKKDPEQLVATTARLLDSQPALRRLREGLVEAQLNTARLLGTRTASHPAVIAAKRAEEKVREDLYSEMENALRGAEAEIAVIEAQIEALQYQLADAQARLDRLASLRAPYSSLAEDVKQREAIVEKAKRDLSDAQARRSAARASSLITRFQSPITGDRPLGPGRTTIVAGGFAGGLVAGVGLLMLTWPSTSSQSQRRWNDILSIGRRATDRIMGRRATDPASVLPDNAVPPSRGPVLPVPPDPSLRRRASDPPASLGRRASDAFPAPSGPGKSPS